MLLLLLLVLFSSFALCLVYRPAIVNLANIDELLSPTDGEIFRVGLAEKGLVGGLYCVHGVA